MDRRNSSIRSNQALLLIVVALAFSIMACPNASPPSEYGAISIVIQQSLAKTLLPAISMEPASYTIAGAGPSDASFTIDTAASTAAISNLASGAWTVTVQAKNASGTVIDSGSATTMVVIGESNLVSITVVPLDGVGTLSITLNWPSGAISNPQIDSQLLPSTGVARNLSFTITGTSASFTANDVPAGYHTLSVVLKDGTTAVAGKVEILRIVKDEITAGIFDFVTINPPGSITANITPDFSDPFLVSILGGQPEKTHDATLNLTAGVTNPTGSLIYTWYVNGVTRSTGPSWSFDNTWASGYYQIDLTVFSSDGKRAGSASTEVTVAPAAIEFYVDGGVGAVFTPRIYLANGGTANWTFSGYGGGSAATATGTGDSPSTSYTGTMLATLVVSPWSALTGINLGYDGGDGGTLPSSYLLAQQNVTSVRHLELGKDSLQVWCSSHNRNLASLSFSGFSALTTVENYFSEGETGGLVTIDVNETPALTRLCLENNNLASLDLSGCPNLADLRGALNAFPSIILPANTASLWHICIRDNPQIGSWSLPALSSFPNLGELYIWGTTRTGTLAMGAANSKISEIKAWNNSYSALDLSSAVFINSGLVDLSYNILTSVNLAGTKNLKMLHLAHNRLTTLDLSVLGNDTLSALDLSDNRLTSAAVDGIFAYLAHVSLVANGTLNLSGGTNSVLSDAAKADKAMLVGRGWAVIDNGYLNP